MIVGGKIGGIGEVRVSISNRIVFVGRKERVRSAAARTVLDFGVEHFVEGGVLILE